MSIERRMQQIGNFFGLSSAYDVPKQLITTPIQSTFEIGPHNHIQWRRFKATQVMTPAGVHTLVDAAVDDTEQYCWQVHMMSWQYDAGTNNINYGVYVQDAASDTFSTSEFVGFSPTSCFPDRGAGWTVAPKQVEENHMGGFIVPPGFSLRFQWTDGGIGATGRIAYILMRYPWGARPLVVSAS